MIVADEIHLIIQDILAELARAEHIHPIWPGVGYRGDHVRATAKLGEEYGELVQAVNNYDEGKGTLGHIRREAVQTGAMAIRFLLNLDAVERQRINESARQDLQEEHNIETGPGDIINWHSPPIRYPQRREGVTLTDYTEGSGVE